MNYSDTANPVSPSDVSLREFVMTTSTALIWSYSGLDSTDTCARTMIVSASAPGLSLTLPPADAGSQGYATLISNIGANTFTLRDNSGGIITTLTTSQSKLISLRTQATPAGTWLPTLLGATTSAADASLLAGYGLEVIASALNSNILTVPFAATQTFNINNRASLAVWTGGTGLANLDLAATLTNGWWMEFYNAGTGNITLTPGGGNLINGVATLVLHPTDSCQVYCTGTGFYTVGLGRSVTTSDSRLSKSVAGGVDITLTTPEVANNVIQFTGLLTANINVIFPVNVKNYYVSNSTTGAFTLTVKTATGSGVVIGQGNSSIITVDGTNVIFANNVNSGTVTSITAGTGLTGGVITNSGTVAIANTAVAAGTYGGATNPFVTLTTNGQGQITAASNTNIINDGSLRIANTADTTKAIAFDVSPIPTSTVRTITVPNANFTMVGVDTTQTLTNKTFSSTNNTMSMTIADLTSGVLGSAVGANVAPVNIGTITTGTVTLAPQTHGPLPYYTNNGAHTLAPPVLPGTMIVEITNGATAGAITTTGFTKVVGDSYALTSGNKYCFAVTRTQNWSSLIIQALQ